MHPIAYYGFHLCFDAIMVRSMDPAKQQHSREVTAFMNSITADHLALHFGIEGDKEHLSKKIKFKTIKPKKKSHLEKLLITHHQFMKGSCMNLTGSGESKSSPPPPFSYSLEPVKQNEVTEWAAVVS